MIKALQAEADLDLRPYLRLLKREGIRHRVTEESGRQVIWVPGEEDALRATALMASWRESGFLNPEISAHETRGNESAAIPVSRLAGGLLQSFMLAPLTVLLIAACLLVALLSRAGMQLAAVEYLFYPDFVIPQGSPLSWLGAVISQTRGPATALQTLTPALLHFGALHLVFNLLWLWYLGSMIEATQPRWRYVLLLLVSAFVANTAQYFTAYSSNFGGMSGVVYGLIGYIGVWQLLLPRSRLRLPPAMLGFFLLALVLMEVFASSWIATAAHVGGLLAGMVCGALFALLHKAGTGRSNARFRNGE